MDNAFLYLFKTVADLYIATFVLRLMLQWVRADYYNPLAQFVIKVTSPLVVPARRVLPVLAGVDVPTLFVLFGLQAIATWALLALGGGTLPLGQFLLYVVLGLINLTLGIYSAAILIYVLLSWIATPVGNRLGTLFGQVLEPLLRPVRRVLPPIAGLDLAPLLVLLLLQAVRIALPLPIILR